MQDRQRILRLVRSRSGISFRDLLRASSMLKKDLMPVIDTLRAEGLIAMVDNAFHPASDESMPVSGSDTDTKRPMISRVK